MSKYGIACATRRSVFFINENNRIPYLDIRYSVFEIRYLFLDPRMPKSTLVAQGFVEFFNDL